MKNLKNSNGVKVLSKIQQKLIVGGNAPFITYCDNIGQCPSSIFCCEGGAGGICVKKRDPNDICNS
jgi:hypothetical protein